MKTYLLTQPQHPARNSLQPQKPLMNKSLKRIKKKKVKINNNKRSSYLLLNLRLPSLLKSTGPVLLSEKPPYTQDLSKKSTLASISLKRDWLTHSPTIPSYSESLLNVPMKNSMILTNMSSQSEAIKDINILNKSGSKSEPRKEPKSK